MKLSLKVEYACRVLVQLAKMFGKNELSHIDQLASAEEIPSNYLVQILNELRNGGLILSRRGKQGGYALARDPNEITLREMVQVIDGELLDLNVSEKGESGPAVAKVWQEISLVLKNKTEEYTLADLALSADEDMYYI